MMAERPAHDRDLARDLLAWWDEGHAELPWRGVRDPYAVWVSEVMLQQTQIATVIPYYERWMARFPTVQALAEAPLADVLKLWEGLGYYGRARNLHAAAQTIVGELGGCLPDTVAGLKRLRGIGDYTAGAIASIAFDRRAPLVDGNVSRVLTRLFDIASDVTESRTRRRLWALAGELVPAERPGDYNQALMELGQTVCLPVAPRCHDCPVRPQCRAQTRGTQLERPVRPPRRRTPHYDVVAGIIWHQDGRLLIARRPLEGLLGGLWEFPGGKCEPGESHAAALRREIREELAVEIAVGRHQISLKHAYTHFRITLHAYHASVAAGQPQDVGVAGHAWVLLEELDDYAFAVTDRRIIASLRELPAKGA
jgi:A/G-specific adenine glycosylase